MKSASEAHGIAGRLASAFIHSRLTPLVIGGSLALGLMAVLAIPREEEPQILVPMLDVMTAMPGASPQEIEQRVTNPVESLMHEIPGVEYVYSISSPGQSLVIVRFLVGTSEEDALIKVYSKLYSNAERMPQGASQPLIKARSIDDVPILALTLWGERYDGYQLRQMADEVQHSIRQIPDVSETTVIGGQPRAMRVILNSSKLAAFGFSPEDVVGRLQAANARTQAGEFAAGNEEIRVDAGNLFRDKQDLEGVVLGVAGGRPVYLRDVADRIVDGPADPQNYVLFGTAAGHAQGSPEKEYPAVTITVAKRKGTNATDIAAAVLARVQQMRGVTLPTDLTITTTRNYGATAKEKSDTLLKHLVLATLTVTLLIALFLGWRESGVVLLAIPVTLALTLAVFYLMGYTLNRVTLFALIFSIGILVDDAIVVVENMVRHFRLPMNARRSLSEVAAEAVAEVGNPTILATFAVIAAILPMAFVRGLMGPYMRPIPVGASVAMLFSLIVAFVVSPWAALRLLGRSHLQGAHTLTPERESRLVSFYRRVMHRLLRSSRSRWTFLGVVALLLVLACALVPLGLVLVKMLPFDNKSEFQVIVNMPDGTPLEETARVAQSLGAYLSQQPEVENYQIYAGTSGPFNFNGLVRHYYMRRQANEADIQVNLLPAGERSAQSHAIARRLRLALDRIGSAYGARLQVSEVPPGPPVLQTLVAEVYGPSLDGQVAVARQVKQIFQQTPGVVDTDWYMQDPQPQVNFRVNEAKAALDGIPVAQVAQTLALATSGQQAGLLHVPESREAVPAVVELDRPERSSEQGLESIRLRGADGSMVSLRELVDVEHSTLQPDIYHKNLKRVVYITGDVAGAEESPVYAILKMNRSLDRLRLPEGYALARYNSVQPESTDRYSMKWDGEWQITIEVFRDLGLAFAAVLILIYVLVVGWFKSFTVPLAIMIPIPLTLVGILPAHAMLGAFFTATSMIGFIAGAGIIVRNSIIVVDFIELRRRQGMPLAEAVIDAGAIRLRPVLLTAGGVIIGASVILADPIFQGLGLSLIAGGVASTFLSWPAVPVLYYMLNAGQVTVHEPALQEQREVAL
ncbi:MAG TPA: efflux RND transporter permease subunit [Acidobacteriaceae bacterium]|jgi:multidrug efflux pump subunit AcrB|nr:efflux RND transporter permease subunit [Acidobacteriaceae bacterium]